MKLFVLVNLVILCYSANCQTRHSHTADRNRSLADSLDFMRPQRSEALYRSYSGGEAAPASLHGRANRNNSSSPVNQSADGGENEPGGNPRRRNGGKTPEKNTVSQLAEYVVALAGAATRRDDCVERFICKMARFIPNFPWRGLVLMLLEPFSPLSSRVMSAIKARVLLNDDCTRFFCYTQSLR